MSVSRTALKWFGREYLAKVEGEEKRRMERAVRHLRNEVMRKLSIRVGRDDGRVTERSKPGEPPRLETGELRRSTATEVVDEGKIIGRVGTNKTYGKWLIVAHDRDFLVNTLNEQRAAIARILVGDKIK